MHRKHEETHSNTTKESGWCTACDKWEIEIWEQHSLFHTALLWKTETDWSTSVVCWVGLFFLRFCLFLIFFFFKDDWNVSSHGDKNYSVCISVYSTLTKKHSSSIYRFVVQSFRRNSTLCFILLIWKVFKFIQWALVELIN